MATQEKKAQKSVTELAAAHAKAHKRLTVIETVGTVLLVFFLLSALAGWAYYKQNTRTAAEPYSINVYR